MMKQKAQDTQQKASSALPSALALARSTARSPVTVLAPEKPKRRCAMRPTRGAEVAAMAPSKHLHSSNYAVKFEK